MLLIKILVLISTYKDSLSAAYSMITSAQMFTGIARDTSHAQVTYLLEFDNPVTKHGNATALQKKALELYLEITREHISHQFHSQKRLSHSAKSFPA